MTGLWGLVDGGIAWYALIRPSLAPADLAPILDLSSAAPEPALDPLPRLLYFITNSGERRSWAE
jgi:hypothetical protein